jgi:DNA-directed RNA polymerase specialized sigma24 family protein
MQICMQYRVVAADAFSTQRKLLWDLCYRVTGTVADADTSLRECFARAVERPSVEHNTEWPQLVRSAAGLAMEALRNRKRRQYVGSWLPAPLETGSAASPGPRPETESGARYDIVESGTIAFLRANEGLEPRERVISVMCDAFGLDLQETATTLDFTLATTRALLLNARRKMQRYDSTHVAPTLDVQARVADRLRECISHLHRLDTARLEKMLALDAQATFDSGGEFVAPPGTVFGAGTIAKLLTKFVEGTGSVSFSQRMLNGMPAAAGQSRAARPRWAQRFVLRVEAREDLVAEVQVMLASAKLTAVRFDPI